MKLKDWFKKNNSEFKIEFINPELRFNITSYPKPYERFSPNERAAKDIYEYERIIFKCGACNNEIEFKDIDF